MKSMTYNEALKKLEYYCNYQDRCYKEIEQKLFEYNLEPNEKENILIYLIENKYINEERFALSFARGKHFYKNWGKVRIKQELKFRDISTNNINLALNEINNGYMDRFVEFATKKWEQLSENNPIKKRNKLIAQLSYKGYESSLIFNFLEDKENK
jgi:regulatory protein